MAKSGIITVSRSIKINQETGKLQVTKAFAEKNLSTSALKYAEKTDNHYFWKWGENGFIVVFEIPKYFGMNFGELLPFLVNYCLDYLQENNLHDDIIYNKYTENLKKKIKA